MPSAFTETTGKKHWHSLLKARAIENFCYIFAPAQGGTHYNGRKTFGHSLIISPDGKIIKDQGKKEGGRRQQSPGRFLSGLALCQQQVEERHLCG